MSEVELAGTVAVVPGMSEALRNLRPQRARGSRVGLYPFVVMIDPAEDVEVDDEQRIDQLMVGDVDWEPASRMLTIASPIPGQVVRVRTGARFYYLASGREPALVRRWGRWQPTDPRPDDSGLELTERGPIGTVSYSGPPQVSPAPNASGSAGWACQNPTRPSRPTSPVWRRRVVNN